MRLIPRSTAFLKASVFINSVLRDYMINISRQFHSAKQNEFMVF